MRPAFLDVDWSRHVKWMNALERPVNVVDAGSGPPLVFIHGHSGCWQNWLEQLPVFMRDHRVVALDLPGFGASPMPRDDVSVTNYARIVDDICAQLGIDAACVVGNSLGGFVAAELAIRSPQRVERLVLVAAAGMSSHYVGLPTEFIRHPGPAAGARVLFQFLGVPDFLAREASLRRRSRRAMGGFVMRHPEDLDPRLFYEQMRSFGGPAGAPAALDLATYDFKDRVGDIACPVLIVWGDRDAIVPLRSAKPLRGFARGRLDDRVRGHRPRADAGASGALQRRPHRLPGRRADVIRAFSLISLGVTLFLFALAANWAQDVAAPWINAGEAQMGSTLTFDADGGEYRVVTSGPSRPRYDATGCTIVAPGGASRRVLGGEGSVNPNDRFGVSRVLEFDTQSGRTQVTCADRYLRQSTRGRFQIVAADGFVSKAVLVGFILAGISLLIGVLLLWRARAR